MELPFVLLPVLVGASACILLVTGENICIAPLPCGLMNYSRIQKIISLTQRETEGNDRYL